MRHKLVFACKKMAMCIEEVRQELGVRRLEGGEGACPSEAAIRGVYEINRGTLNL